MSIRNFPERLSQRILAGIVLVGRLGLRASNSRGRPGEPAMTRIQTVSPRGGEASCTGRAPTERLGTLRRKPSSRLEKHSRNAV